MAETWLNSDGLYIKYGRKQDTKARAGEYEYDGDLHLIEALFNAVDLGSSSTIIDDTVTVPNGARIYEVHVIAETACTGSGAVLNVGLIDQDRSTALDADGLVAGQILTTLDAAGETTKNVVGSTYAGALIGTTLTNTGLICADYDTAAFTAGKIAVKIFYYFPVATSTI